MPALPSAAIVNATAAVFASVNNASGNTPLGDTPGAASGDLPCWDLSDLYPGPDSPDLTADLEGVEGESVAFEDRYKGRLETLDGPGLAEAITAYEALEQRTGRLMSFASLTHACAMDDPDVGRFFQNMQESVNRVTLHLLFFQLELNRLPQTWIDARCREDSTVAHYSPWLRTVRAFREHQLEDTLERLLHEREVVGTAAWVRLFDETLAGLRFTVGETERTVAEVLELLSDPDATLRAAAAAEIGRVLDDRIRLFSLISNTLAKEKEIDDIWRGYARPVSGRNLGNQVEDAVVDALVASVRDAYPRLSHRYYRLKARWLNQEVLNHWDRNAPLPEDDDRPIPWSEARDTVLDAYAAFSPEMAALGRRFFDHPWIDAPVAAGKASGAFSHPTVVGVHPYILLNYQGRVRDVMTLAHELGHGVHQILAAEQGELMAHTPLTLAETASVFGEMLTFQSMLRQEPDPRRRRILLATKIEDKLNTVVRQIAFHQFESRLHDTRRQGELTPEQIGDLWLAVQQESLGPAFVFDESYRSYWAYIPHFIHSPFYVYAYAFGDCLVNSLYAVYQEKPDGFAERYLDLLRAGGSRRHGELLAPFGLDATTPAFWEKGLDFIVSLIDELETLSDDGS